MGIHDPLHRAKGTLARTELASGYIVSTVRLRAGSYETATFSPGWPEAGDAVTITTATTSATALTHHAEAVQRWAETSPPDGVFFRLA